MSAQKAEPEKDREIISTRVFDAPVELVWRAYTEPYHLEKWWGPKGFTNTFKDYNFKPGGVWKYTMHGPDGKNYENECVFAEMVEPARIVIDHVSTPKFRITITLEDLGQTTQVTFHQLFETVAVYNGVKVFAVPGNEQNFDKLADHMRQMV